MSALTKSNTSIILGKNPCFTGGARQQEAPLNRLASFFKPNNKKLITSFETAVFSAFVSTELASVGNSGKQITFFNWLANIFKPQWMLSSKSILKFKEHVDSVPLSTTVDDVYKDASSKKRFVNFLDKWFESIKSELSIDGLIWFLTCINFLKDNISFKQQGLAKAIKKWQDMKQSDWAKLKHWDDAKKQFALAYGDEFSSVKQLPRDTKAYTFESGVATHPLITKRIFPNQNNVMENEMGSMEPIKGRLMFTGLLFRKFLKSRQYSTEKIPKDTQIMLKKSVDNFERHFKNAIYTEWWTYFKENEHRILGQVRDKAYEKTNSRDLFMQCLQTNFQLRSEAYNQNFNVGFLEIKKDIKEDSAFSDFKQQLRENAVGENDCEMDYSEFKKLLNTLLEKLETKEKSKFSIQHIKDYKKELIKAENNFKQINENDKTAVIISSEYKITVEFSKQDTVIVNQESLKRFITDARSDICTVIRKSSDRTTSKSGADTGDSSEKAKNASSTLISDWYFRGIKNTKEESKEILVIDAILDEVKLVCNIVANKNSYEINTIHVNAKEYVKTRFARRDGNGEQYVYIDLQLDSRDLLQELSRKPFVDYSKDMKDRKMVCAFQIPIEQDDKKFEAFFEEHRQAFVNFYINKMIQLQCVFQFFDIISQRNDVEKWATYIEEKKVFDVDEVFAYIRNASKSKITRVSGNLLLVGANIALAATIQPNTIEAEAVERQSLINKNVVIMAIVGLGATFADLLPWNKKETFPVNNYNRKFQPAAAILLTQLLLQETQNKLNIVFPVMMLATRLIWNLEKMLPITNYLALLSLMVNENTELGAPLLQQEPSDSIFDQGLDHSKTQWNSILQKGMALYVLSILGNALSNNPSSKMNLGKTITKMQREIRRLTTNRCSNGLLAANIMATGTIATFLHTWDSKMAMFAALKLTEVQQHQQHWWHSHIDIKGIPTTWRATIAYDRESANNVMFNPRRTGEHELFGQISTNVDNDTFAKDIHTCPFANTILGPPKSNHAELKKAVFNFVASDALKQSSLDAIDELASKDILNLWDVQVEFAKQFPMALHAYKMAISTNAEINKELVKRLFNDGENGFDPERIVRAMKRFTDQTVKIPWFRDFTCISEVKSWKEEVKFAFASASDDDKTTDYILEILLQLVIAAVETSACLITNSSWIPLHEQVAVIQAVNKSLFDFISKVKSCDYDKEQIKTFYSTYFIDAFEDSWFDNIKNELQKETIKHSEDLWNEKNKALAKLCALKNPKSTMLGDYLRNTLENGAPVAILTRLVLRLQVVDVDRASTMNPEYDENYKQERNKSPYFGRTKSKNSKFARRGCPGFPDITLKQVYMVTRGLLSMPVRQTKDTEQPARKAKDDQETTNYFLTKRGDLRKSLEHGPTVNSFGRATRHDFVVRSMLKELPNASQFQEVPATAFSS